MFPISGGVPVMPQFAALPQGGRLWIGSLQCLGNTSAAGFSGVEFFHFASQPIPVAAISGTVPPYLPPLQRIYAAIPFGTVYQGTSGVHIPVLASGGLPDTISGGREALSGVAAPGAVQGPVVAVQWLQMDVVGSGVTRVATSNAPFVSGNNVGFLLWGY